MPTRWHKVWLGGSILAIFMLLIVRDCRLPLPSGAVGGGELLVELYFRSFWGKLVYCIGGVDRLGVEFVNFLRMGPLCKGVYFVWFYGNCWVICWNIYVLSVLDGFV